MSGSVIGMYHLEVKSCSPIAPFWDILERQYEAKFSQWAELQAVCLVVLFSWEEKCQMCDCIQIHGLWPVLWLDGYGLGRNIIGKLMTGRYREGVYGWMVPLNG